MDLSTTEVSPSQTPGQADAPLFGVGIGASAGGLEALMPLVAKLRANGAVTYVVAQHLAPDHPSALVELLSARCPLKVVPAEFGQPLKADHVYIAPPGQLITVEQGRIVLAASKGKGSPAPSINRLFESLASCFHERAVGLLLSGTGSDGTLGGKAIKSAGGRILVQTPESLQHQGLVSSASSTKIVDHILDADQLPEWLNRLPETVVTPGSMPPEKRRGRSTAFDDILERVYKLTQLDVSRYKKATLQRQIGRRMAALHLDSTDDYLRLIDANPDEAHVLQRYFLISVTEFFRDKPVFDDLRAALAAHLEQKGPGQAIRVWVPACASGEEAYSIAILLLDMLGARAASVDLQLFGTDIDAEAIQTARTGLYPDSAIAKLSADLRKTYFTREGNRYRIAKAVRDRCVFAVHDLIDGPPFVRMDLISCRNLLIYLQSELQEDLLGRFHYALHPKGLLLLGKSESIGQLSGLFEPLKGSGKVFRKNDANSPPNFRLRRWKASWPKPAQTRKLPVALDYEAALSHFLVEHYAPASVLINAQLQPLHFMGNIEQFLSFTSGSSDFSILSLCRPELQSELRTALHKLSLTPTEVIYGNTVPWGNADVTVTARRFLSGDPVAPESMLVSFECHPRTSAAAGGHRTPKSSGSNSQATDARIELEATREHLLAVTEELEASQETVQSMMEEMQASSEELQSSNEELQASNEELTTLNDELRAKSDELETLNDILNNIQNSVPVGLVVVDQHGLVRRYNNLAVRIFGLMPKDIGHHLASIPCSLALPQLRARIDSVIADSETLIERVSHNQRHFIMQVSPYVGDTGQHFGAILTFTDVSDLHMAELAFQRSEEKFRQIVTMAKEGIWSLDAQLKTRFVNAALARLLGEEPETMTGKPLVEFLFPEDRAEALAHLGDESDAAGSHAEQRFRRADGAECWCLVSSTRVYDETGHLTGSVAILTDISDRLRDKARIAALAAIVESSEDAIVSKTLDGVISSWNRGAEKIFGYTADEVVGRPVTLLFPEERIDEETDIISRLLKGEVVEHFVTERLHKNGQRVAVSMTISPIRDASGRIVGASKIARDISEAKLREQALQASEERFRLTFEHAGVGVAHIAPDGRLLRANRRFCEIVEYTLPELQEKSFQNLIFPDDTDLGFAEVSRLLDEDGLDHFRAEKRYIRKDESLIWVNMTFALVRDPGGNVLYIIAVVDDITHRKLAENREAARSHVLEQLARNAPLAEILESIVRDVEQENPKLIASILLLDDTRRYLLTAAAPSLPQFYSQAIDGLTIGPGVGSCGESACSGQRVVVVDIDSHPNWADFRQIAKRAGLKSCWSEPLIGSTGQVLGTFAVYRRDGTAPSEADETLIGHASRLAGIAVERSRAEDAQRLACLVYENSSEAIVVTDASTRIVAINPAFTAQTGYTLSEVIGRNPKILSSGRQDRGFYEAMWHDLSSTGQWQGEIWNRRKDGEEYAEWLVVNTIYDMNGEVYRRVGLATDITEKKKADTLIWTQANFDALTQLPNRRLFADRMDLEIRKAHRDNKQLALLFIDLDRFKEVNDALGHPKGDELLVSAARRIKACVRESDSVARLGGDEFTVLLPNVTNPADIDRVARAIARALKKPFQLGEDQLYTSASIGITVYPDDATTVDALLKNADQAMYSAKREGRSRYAYFTYSMQEDAQSRMRLVRDLHLALEAKEFLVHFQPIVDLNTGRVRKAEALLRWNHPHRGFVSPADFIPVAEDTGAINDIGAWVFQEATIYAKRWQSAYDPNFQISVNKSPVQFHAESNSKDRCIELLMNSDLPGNSIVIEITERLLLNADKGITDKLLVLRDAGVQVAIDDFGTGYSSLSYLKKFDIDYLKIDQSFVRNLATDESDLALSEAIVVMAHKLGLKVIAEGVETEQQRDILLNIGCDFGQGYFFSRPLPPDSFEAYLQSTANLPVG